MAEEYNPFQSPRAPPRVPSQSAPRIAYRGKGFVSGNGVASCAMLLLGIVALTDVIGCAICFSQYYLIASIGQNPPPPQSAFEANDQASFTVAWVNGGVSLLAMLAFLAWTDRAYRNLPALGNSSPRSTPFWAVAWWFVPFANFVMPCEIMAEIAGDSDPAQFKELHKRTPPLVGLWWGAFLLSNFVESIVIVYAYVKIYGGAKRPSLESAIGVTTGFVAMYAIELVAAIYAIRLVNWIDKSQQAKFNLVVADRPAPAPDAREVLLKTRAQRSERRSNWRS